MATDATIAENTHLDIAASGGFGVLIATLLTLIAECALFGWGIMQGNASPALLLVIHGIIIAVLILWARGVAKAGEPAHMLLLLVILTGFLGPLGAGGVLLTLLLSSFFDTRPFSEWFADIFPEQDIPEGKQLVEYLQRYQDQVAENATVIPFREVLMLGTTPQKMRMIGQMTRNYHPAFAPGLMMALRDNSNAVRVQAATAIARIEDAYETQMTMLERHYQQNKQNPATLKALGTIYDNFAYAGILDEDRASEYRNKALIAYQDYLKSEPEDQVVSLAVARIYYREGDYEELIRWGEACLGRGMEDVAMLLWLMEGYYALKDYAAITNLAERYEHKLQETGNSLPLEVKEALDAWSHGLPDENTLEKQAEEAVDV